MNGKTVTTPDWLLLAKAIFAFIIALAIPLGIILVGEHLKGTW